jgi:hypothetical protein
LDCHALIGHALGWHVGFCCCVGDRYERQLFFERQSLMNTVLILELSYRFGGGDTKLSNIEYR